MTNEDLAKYCQKSGDSMPHTANLIENEHGFASYYFSEDGESIILLSVYGDGRYWDSFFEDMARENGLKRVRFVTKRDPRLFARKYGYRVTGYHMEKEVK